MTLDKQLMATEVKTGKTFEPGATNLLFQTHASPSIIPAGGLTSSDNQYFVADNGQRFLINSITNTPRTEIMVLLNWKSLLKK